MKITHIEHSGFCVELTDTVLIFDWYTGKLPEFPQEKELYVFSSHFHGDHYGSCIWTLAAGYPRVHYILSQDTRRLAKRDAPQTPALFVGPHETHQLGAVLIQTLRSTDEGVAFLVKAEGKLIYHAGDLNLWYWEGEADDFNHAQIRDYQAEILRLKSLLDGAALDVAFHPLDPRLEGHAADGLSFFLEHLACRELFPMHYWTQKGVAVSLTQQPPLSEADCHYHFEDSCLL